MTEKGHWPFSGEQGAHDAEDARHRRDDESKRARAAQQAAFRQRMRNDRLIVGGRAHTKKRGLS